MESRISNRILDKYNYFYNRICKIILIIINRLSRNYAKKNIEVLKISSEETPREILEADFKSHLDKKDEKMIEYKTEYWFDIISFYGVF